MQTFDELDYVPFYTHKPDRSRLLAAEIDGKPCRFHVYHELHPCDTPLVAHGALSQDGTELFVTYTMPDGVMGSLSYDYQRLKQVVSHYEELGELAGRC